MRLGKSRLLVPALLTFLVITVAVPPQVVHGDELQQKQQDKAASDARQQQLRGRLGLLEDGIKANGERLSATQTQLERAKGRLADVQDRVGKTNQQLKTVEAKLQQVQADMARRQHLIGVRVRSLAEEGRTSYIDILFGSTSLSDFIDRLQMLRLVVQQDASLFRQLRATRAQVEHTKQEVSAQKEQVLGLQQQAVSEKQTVEARLSDIQTIKAQLANDKRQLLAAMDEEEARAQQLTSEIAAIQRRMNRHHDGKLALDFPVRPVSITDPFGMRMHPILHVYRMHYGTDFAADEGQEVRAAESGTVVQAGWNGAYGISVIIDHGDGVSTLYGHNSKLKVSEGDTVKAGQVIGLAGSTGWATGPHVHFEVRVNGTPQNPMNWLPDL